MRSGRKAAVAAFAYQPVSQHTVQEAVHRTARQIELFGNLCAIERPGSFGQQIENPHNLFQSRISKFLF